MDVFIVPLFDLLYTLISIYKWVVILSVIISWLIAFNIINTYSDFVSMITDALYRLTEPVLQPIRRILPSLGGLDLSPIALLLLLHFLQSIMARAMMRFYGG